MDGPELPLPVAACTPSLIHISDPTSAVADDPVSPLRIAEGDKLPSIHLALLRACDVAKIKADCLKIAADQDSVCPINLARLL